MGGVANPYMTVEYHHHAGAVDGDMANRSLYVACTVESYVGDMRCFHGLDAVAVFQDGDIRTGFGDGVDSVCVAFVLRLHPMIDV